LSLLIGNANASCLKLLDPGVIPKARAFTSGLRACPEQASVANASNGDLPCSEATTELGALNMSAAEQKISADTGKMNSSTVRSLAATGKSAAKGNVVTLEPFGVFIGQFVHRPAK